MTAAGKITAAHLERLAVVYVRQSTIAQVREHTESTARQYALAEEAARLGWSAERIAVIDADLGVSGRTASARSGFKELVGRVCVGEVGAILGLEVSRLARSSADLQRLLELCALTETPRLFQRPFAAGLEGHHERGGVAFTRGPPAGRQTRRGTARRTAFPAAGRLRL